LPPPRQLFPPPPFLQSHFFPTNNTVYPPPPTKGVGPDLVFFSLMASRFFSSLYLWAATILGLGTPVWGGCFWLFFKVQLGLCPLGKTVQRLFLLKPHTQWLFGGFFFWFLFVTNNPVHTPPNVPLVFISSGGDVFHIFTPRRPAGPPWGSHHPCLPPTKTQVFNQLILQVLFRNFFFACFFSLRVGATFDPFRVYWDPFFWAPPLQTPPPRQTSFAGLLFEGFFPFSSFFFFHFPYKFCFVCHVSFPFPRGIPQFELGMFHAVSKGPQGLVWKSGLRCGGCGLVVFFLGVLFQKCVPTSPTFLPL